MNLNKIKILFILFCFKLIACFTSNQTVNDFICGVNDSDFRFDPTLVPMVRQKSVAILEIGLFYDQYFLDRFATDFRNVMKSVMRQVQIIYQYPSMKSQIRLVVTRLTKIEVEKVAKPKLIKEYLYAFCDFQLKTYWNPHKDYDLALLFTGLELYSEF